MKKISISIILSVCAILTFTSCQKTQDPGGTKTAKFAGDWWVNLYVGGQKFYSTEKKMSTYNTAANVDSIWVDDLGNLYGFVVQAGVSQEELTFSTKDAENGYYNGTPNFPATVTITDGKVMKNAGHSKTGNITDSIYFKAIFSDDPTTTYEIKGVASTNRAEDNY
jgi:hypothetical protein